MIKVFGKMSEKMMMKTIENIQDNWCKGCKAQATIGTYVGGGVDFAIGRYLMLGASAGYHLIANFAEPIRGRKNFSGPELSISLSLLWGKDVGEVKSIRR